MAEEDNKSDHDQLFDVKNAFYLGNYQNCINSASRLKKLSEELDIYKDVYVYRSYLALKKYKLIIDEIAKKDNYKLYPIMIYAQFLSNQLNKESFEEKIEEYTNQADNLFKIIASTFYIRHKENELAYNLLVDTDDLECLSLLIQIYLQMFRIDLARNTLIKMQAIDEDATLTQLSSAWINLASSTEKGAQEAMYIFQEYVDKYPPSVILLNGLSSAHVLLKNFEDAETYLRDALEKDANNAETLVNLIAVSQLTNKPQESERLLNQVLDEFPDHPFAIDYKSKEAEFDKFSKMYMEGIKVLPPPKG